MAWFVSKTQKSCRELGVTAAPSCLPRGRAEDCLQRDDMPVFLRDRQE